MMPHYIYDVKVLFYVKYIYFCNALWYSKTNLVSISFRKTAGGIRDMEKEYDTLRNEINQKIELHNSLITFTITTTVAILTFALSQNNVFLYLTPFCIIIPMSMRIAYYRSALSKLSAYIIVFLEKNLEGMNWETRNAMLTKETLGKKRKFKIPTVLPYYECLILSAVCYICYLYEYTKNKDINIQTVCFLCFPSLLVIWEMIMAKRINSFDKEKQAWISIWKDLQELDCK